MLHVTLIIVLDFNTFYRKVSILFFICFFNPFLKFAVFIFYRSIFYSILFSFYYIIYWKYNFSSKYFYHHFYNKKLKHVNQIFEAWRVPYKYMNIEQLKKYKPYKATLFIPQFSETSLSCITLPSLNLSIHE